MITLKTFALKSAVVGVCLVAATFSAPAANAGGLSFSFGFGTGDAMTDNGVTIGDPMGYPLLADGPTVVFHGPDLPLGPQIDQRKEAERRHYCDALKEIRAEIKLIRAHWNKAFFKYEFGPTRDETLKMDQEALDKWTAMEKEYEKKCYGE